MPKNWDWNAGGIPLKKSTFFRAAASGVLQVNEQILADRGKLEAIELSSMTEEGRAWFQALAGRYLVDLKDRSSTKRELLMRVAHAISMGHYLGPLVFISHGFSVFVFAGAPNAAIAQEETIQERMFHSRAIDAIVWAMPLLNFKGFRDGHASVGVGYNDIAYHSKIQDWKFQTATPNNTTPYVNVYWSIKDGPMVVEIPPSADGVGIFGTDVSDFLSALV